VVSGGPFTPDTTVVADEIDKFLISIMDRQMQPLNQPSTSMQAV